jgi:hypothetical protein
MNIIHPNHSFDFTKLTLAQPSGIQGGAYFTKINYNQSPLYIQTPKSFTKQAIITSGKKLYCDLMFENQLIMLIEWFEKLETTCQQLLFEKSPEWFQDPLQLNDIENVFNSILKIYKSGKYYLARVNVKNTIKIYDETRNVLSVEDITTETPIISILEIQGIKFTSRNFQIEIELKQAMIIDNSPVFDNCLISPLTQDSGLIVVGKKDGDIFKDESEPDVKVESVVKDESEPAVKYDSEPVVKDESEPAVKYDSESVVNDKPIISDDEEDITTNQIVLDLDFEDLTENDKKEDLIEITELSDLSTQVISEPFVLKKPNDVYYKIYREARTKAKEAKKQSILALLEAKNIKKTYMLEKIEGSDDEFDDEIDNISESELFI